MNQQSSSPNPLFFSALLWQVVGAAIVAVVLAAGIGGPTLALAPDFSFGLIAPLICPSGGRIQYTATHSSYQRPGESSPHVECWPTDGTHREVTGPAILTFFGGAIALVFVPVFALTFITSLRPPPARRPTVTPSGAPAAAGPAPRPASAASVVVAQRLDTLEALHAQGKITAQEYEQKRGEILSGL